MHKDNALYFKTILKKIFCMMIFHDNCAYFHFKLLFFFNLVYFQLFSMVIISTVRVFLFYCTLHLNTAMQ